MLIVSIIKHINGKEDACQDELKEYSSYIINWIFEEA